MKPKKGLEQQVLWSSDQDFLLNMKNEMVHSPKLACDVSAGLKEEPDDQADLCESDQRLLLIIKTETLDCMNPTEDISAGMKEEPDSELTPFMSEPDFQLTNKKQETLDSTAPPEDVSFGPKEELKDDHDPSTLMLCQKLRLLM